jgi:uncharacterized protein YjbJ (UPF0337 family)
MEEPTTRDDATEQPRTPATSTPDTAEKDRLAGGVDQAKGRVKESVGALTGNENLKAQGEADQITGKAESKKGQFKDRLKSWINRL